MSGNNNNNKKKTFIAVTNYVFRYFVGSFTVIKKKKILSNEQQWVMLFETMHFYDPI